MINAVRTPALKSPAKAAIIFCHGLGDTGSGWSFFNQLINQSKLVKNHETINYVYPNAPTMPVSVNFGMSMTSWFDMFGFTPDSQQDTEGFLKSIEVLKQAIKEQIEVHNVPSEKIIIGGFSQGAAISLATLALLDIKIGGVVALSGFVTIKDKIKELHRNDINHETPIFQGHGIQDDLVLCEYGEKTSDFYKSLGFSNYQFKKYNGVGHSASEEELVDAIRFIDSAINKNV
ncbi:acyl-protein thioesterase 1 [Hyphopichia burtonii NRRL Y-1933]|uniref:Acyl-protein thioesterase 1 n=1 Tax=Hyphopichia burtonii NRRL Y-1933 TaxID=984485 RepID=A0A1E4RHR1_9ASCO|nr:acyl-protein thioesterase 1 [Hyphopichia burtonii NRRL Y-1933]ODV66645.1 acyl-protein thioesterase 1 [Hyphopichia burtonii NRRL Y-1933]